MALRDHTFIMLCWSALKFTYYAQYYVQEQILWSDYNAIYVQVYMNNSIHIHVIVSAKTVHVRMQILAYF